MGIDDSGPILEPVDWATLESESKDEIRDRCSALKSIKPVRRWIDQANDPELQQLNLEIVDPIARAKSSIVAGTMSGLSQWISPSDPTAVTPDMAHRYEKIDVLLASLSRPVTDRMSRNGIQLLEPPRAWNPDALAMQERAKARVETPYIRDLQAGEGEFVGPQGYVPYIQRVATERTAYAPINESLLRDWRKNYARLSRVREAASKHLWPKLHGEWLPALLNDEPDAVREFPQWIGRALMQRPLANLFNLPTAQVYCASLGVLGAAAVIQKQLSPAELAEIATLGSAGLAFFLKRPLAPQSGPLAVFYQQAFKTLT